MKTRTLLGRRWVRALLALLLIGVAVAGTFWIAHHVANRVDITITYYGAPPGTPPQEAAHWSGRATSVTVYTATITDAGRARALQALWNNTGTISPFVSFSCEPGGSPYVYTFRFSFLGVPVQDLSAAQDGCNVFRLTTLGITSPLMHGWPTRALWRQIVQLSGIPNYNASVPPPAG